MSNPVEPRVLTEPAFPTVVPAANGVFHVEYADGRRRIAFGVADGANTWVFLDGETYVIASAPARRTATGQDLSALTAPMPATVTQLHVTSGQPVTAGDVLVTLEAMKMELSIRAPADGIVQSINCRVGEMVQPGTPLVELQPSGSGQVTPGGMHRP